MCCQKYTARVKKYSKKYAGWKGRRRDRNVPAFIADSSRNMAGRNAKPWIPALDTTRARHGRL